MPVSSVRPATNAPGVTCWTNTEKKNAPTSPPGSPPTTAATPPTVAASTRGTTSAWIGLMPITRSASSSSRMVRAPRSAHIAVAPAPATTSTVTIGPIWLTVPIAAPVPEKSAAPNSISRMLKVNTINTVNGIASISAGNDRHPRHEPALQQELPPRERRLEHRHEGVQRHREEAAHARTGLVARYVAIRCAPATRSSAWGRPASPAAADRHGQPAAWPERYRGDSTVTAPPRGIIRPSSESQGPRLSRPARHGFAMRGASKRRMPDCR